MKEDLLAFDYKTGQISAQEYAARLEDMGYSGKDIEEIMSEGGSVSYPDIEDWKPPHPKNWHMIPGGREYTSKTPKYGLFWAYKTPWWVSKKEHKYDAMHILAQERGIEAHRRYTIALDRFSFLQNSIDDLQVLLNDLNNTLVVGGSSLSTESLTETMQRKNSVERQLENAKKEQEDMKIDMDRDRKIMHEHRDAVAKAYIRDGPLTSENRALVYSVVALGVGILGASAVYEFITDVTPLDFSSGRVSPIAAVFR